MVLIVFFNSRISPLTVTVILRDRSPRATAVVTSAILRTCVVKLTASKLRLSVKSFRLPAQPAFGRNLAGHADDLRGERPQLLDHRIQGLLEQQDFAAHVHGDLLR